jgi:hypothetical protein
MPPVERTSRSSTTPRTPTGTLRSTGCGLKGKGQMQRLRYEVVLYRHVCECIQVLLVYFPLRSFAGRVPHPNDLFAIISPSSSSHPPFILVPEPQSVSDHGTVVPRLLSFDKICLMCVSFLDLLLSGQISDPALLLITWLRFTDRK